MTWSRRETGQKGKEGERGEMEGEGNVRGRNVQAEGNSLWDLVKSRWNSRPNSTNDHTSTRSGRQL